MNLSYKCSSLLFFILFSWLFVATTMLPEQVFGADSARQIKQIKQERARLAKLQQTLQRDLGAVGRQLRALDGELIAARASRREISDQVKLAKGKLKTLHRDRKEVRKRIKDLKKLVMDESVAAWQRSSRSSPWMGLLTGVPVSDIPHRRYLLNVVMHAQQQASLAYMRSVEKLAKIESELIEQRDRLAPLLIEKRKSEKRLQKRLRAKRHLANKVKKKISKSKRKDSRLAHEERVLRGLLKDFSKHKQLAVRDIAAPMQKVRQRKGKLKWPLKGTIVASYHSFPTKGMPRLQGVQLRPRHQANSVKAMAAGQVRYADWFGGYGLMTIVDYGEGILGVYAHNDVIHKQLGDWVEEGEILAEAGSTGWVSKPLLYFEIRDRGKAVNPKRWCRR
ncbi:MAG: peptidoglycan DD-metalloendopeptidase family protein [Mariprofundus sp.]|nr:peptidoglycan DD-metalloendopeptidase family protein [Mariprofundus sp.]